MVVAREILLVTTIVLMILFIVSIGTHFVVKKFVEESEKKEKIIRILNIILVSVSILFVVSSIAFVLANIFAAITF